MRPRLEPPLAFGQLLARERQQLLHGKKIGISAG